MTLAVDPHGLLAGVHSDLARVVVLAGAKCKSMFIVIQGLRTVEQEAAAVASGHSQTMHSRHLPDANYGGKACAVDVAVEEHGIINWSPKAYYPVAAAIMEASHETGVLVEWGGSWLTLKDFGHFQLPWKLYP